MWGILKMLGGLAGKFLGPAAAKLAGRSRLWVIGSIAGLLLSLPPEVLSQVADKLFWLGMAYVLAESAKDIVVAYIGRGA